MEVKTFILKDIKKHYLKFKKLIIGIFIIILIGEMKVMDNLKKKSNYKNRYKFMLHNLPSYNHTHIYNNTIFWCWLQEKIDIPIVNACLNSIIKNNKGNKITIINQNNIHQYVHIPPYILQKYNNHTISKTHFSDLLRLELLIKYGGTWIDATVLMTKYNKNFFRKDLFLFQSIGKKRKSLSNWFLTSEKESPVLKTLLDLLYEFWRTNFKLRYYFIFHHLLKLIFIKYKKEYNKILKYSSYDAHLMQKNLLKPFNNSFYKQITKKISIHKLTYKLKNRIKNKKGLLYHHILQEYY